MSKQPDPGTKAKTGDIQEMQLAKLVCRLLPESVAELQSCASA